MRALVFDKEPAYVLHSRPYQENTYLVEFLTLVHGRITVMARMSAKMIGKNFQQFVPMLLTCSKGGEMYNLRGLELRDKCVLTAPQSMMLGMYVNEIIIRMIFKHLGSARLFKLYARTLADLNDSATAECTLRRFEVGVLEISGHGMQLAYTADDHQPLEPDGLYDYEPGSGPFEHRANSRNGLPVCHGKTLLALKDGLNPDDEQMLEEARDLMRCIIGYHLRGRDINTRSIFQYLQGLN